MSIDEAITHCLAVADGQTEQGRCPECAADHRQLAEWLTELKGYRERMSCDNEGITPKSITTAFQFGIVMGFGKKYDEMDKVMEEIKKAVNPQPDEDCDTCKHGYFGDHQCDNCRVRYPSHYERKEEHHGSD